MANFFRGIRRGLLQNNRVVKYLFYALGEILLVVIGILIALQLNNWAENRKNKLDVSNLLNAVKLDNTRNLQQLELKIAQSKHIRAHIKGLLLHMGPDISSKEPRIIDSLLFNSFSVVTFNPQTAAILNITASKNFGLVTHDGLRKRILEWDANFQWVKNIENSSGHVYKTIVLPYFYKHISLVRLDRQFDTESVQLPASSIIVDNRMVLRELEAQNILEDHYYNAGKLLNRLESFQKDLESLNLLLNRETQEP